MDWELAGHVEALELSDVNGTSRQGGMGALSDEDDQCDDESAKHGKATAKLRNHGDEAVTRHRPSTNHPHCACTSMVGLSGLHTGSDEDGTAGASP